MGDPDNFKVKVRQKTFLAQNTPNYVQNQFVEDFIFLQTKNGTKHTKTYFRLISGPFWGTYETGL